MANGGNARAWLVWTAAAAILALVTRNPLYALLLILAARLVEAACGRREPALELPWRRIAVAVLLFSTLFNALLVHTGETILFRLPRALPVVGGPITLEAAVYGLTTGLVLLALLFVFLAFNRIVPVSELVRLVPRAFHDLGVVLLIAVTYVPETARRLEHVREAQAIRGHRVRGLRDWRPLLVPLLVGGMERAMGLAEAMVARGYGSAAPRAHQPAVLAGVALGLLLLLGGWLYTIWEGTLGWLFFIAGALLLLALVWRRGRAVQHTQYRQQPWRRQDSLLVAVSLVVLIAGLWQQEAIAGYSPYPRVQLPPFAPGAGALFLLLALPALLCRRPA